MDIFNPELIAQLGFGGVFAWLLYFVLSKMMTKFEALTEAILKSLNTIEDNRKDEEDRFARLEQIYNKVERLIEATYANNEVIKLLLVEKHGLNPDGKKKKKYDEEE